MMQAHEKTRLIAVGASVRNPDETGGCLGPDPDLPLAGGLVFAQNRSAPNQRLKGIELV